MAYRNILEWNKAMGYASPQSYPQGFVGPTRPGDYVGGVNPYNGSRDPRILGATTTGGSQPASSSSQPVVINMPQDDAARRAEEERNAERARLEGLFNDYEGRVQGMRPELERNQADEIASTTSTYDKIFGGLTEQKQGNLDKLAANRGLVEQRRASSLDDLKRNLAEALRGSQITLGAMGAGDTSASRTMLPYAYNKIAGRESGGIIKQANDQQFQIDMDEKDTEMKFSEMWKDTEIAKDEAIRAVKDKYGNLLMQVSQMLANVPLQRAQISQGLLDRADAELRQIQAEDRQRKENIRTWTTQRMSELNNMKLSLANQTNFNPTDIVYNEIQPLLGNFGGANSPGLMNSVLARKRREDYLGA